MGLHKLRDVDLYQANLDVHFEDAGPAVAGFSQSELEVDLEDGDPGDVELGPANFNTDLKDADLGDAHPDPIFADRRISMVTSAMRLKDPRSSRHYRGWPMMDRLCTAEYEAPS